MLRDRESWQMQEALQWLSIVIFDEGKRKVLLELRDDDAQSMIDFLNALLSHPDLVDPKLRKHTLIVLQKLCENSMLYPSCYPLDGVENILLKGAGGFCDIYQGRYQGQVLCLKVVRLYEKGDQNKMLKAHAREAILWNQLKHPNVVPFYGIFYLEELQRRIGLLSPWMENGNIVGYLKGSPQLPRKQILYDIACGLKYLHSENIVHGDLKGANVLVDGASTARLSDFGLSKILTDATLGFPDTSGGVTGLTTNWASPELLEESARPSRASDIWAFGCVCYEILTGSTPFHGCTGIQVVRKIIDRKLPAQPVNDKLDQNTAVNKKIWSLVKRCWSYEVARRPECSEILQEMESDALVWQIRAEGSNCGNQLSQYTPKIGNHIVDHNKARSFLEVIGAVMDKEGYPVINYYDEHISSYRLGFVNPCLTVSPRSLPSHCSLSPLQNPQAGVRDATGVPSSASPHAPPALRPSPSRPSFVRFPSSEDAVEDHRGCGGEKSRGQPPTLGSGFFCGLFSCLQFFRSRTSYRQASSPLQGGLSIVGDANNLAALNEFSTPIVDEERRMHAETRYIRHYRPHRPNIGSLPSPNSNSLAVPSLLSLNLEQPLCRHSSPEQHHAGTFFDGASGFVLTNCSFIDHDDDRFMENLLRSTLSEVEFDSSSRYPPPRCRFGTRMKVIERCLHFIAHCSGSEKVRWVFGAAGVGKSAIMQSVAESPGLPGGSCASVFLSANKRSDGAKIIVTLCYQFAAKYVRYRQIVERELMRDPSLLRKAMPVQFNKFIVEPFITASELNSIGRTIVVIDGLDECDDRNTQLQLLRLITEFCITYPSSPLVWLIASRPEQHITSFFSTPTIQPAYEKEEIFADSDDSCEDVKLFLRHEPQNIKRGTSLLNHQPEWPKERDFLVLANASEGLFAYARAVTDYIGNSAAPVTDPVSGLRDVVRVIEGHPIPDGLNPLAPLDALYTRILSNVPLGVMENTRKLLLALALEWDWFLYPGESNVIVLCNWLAMTAHDAYAALSPLFSVLRVPLESEAHEERLKIFHKSFISYISDFSRSGLFQNIELEARQLKYQCMQRILKEAPEGVDFGSTDYESFFGDLLCGPGIGDKISLTWPADEEGKWNDSETRLSVYKTAIGSAVDGIRRGEPGFQNEFYVRLLTTRFKRYGYFPYDELADMVFDESRRAEFTRDGLLKQVPLEAIDLSNLDEHVRLCFRLPGSVPVISDAWNLTCAHKRKGEWEEGDDHEWTTDIPRACSFGWERFEQQLESWKIQQPDCTIPILFSSTGRCCVELQILDSEPLSLWTYRLWIELSLDERKKYGSTV